MAFNSAGLGYVHAMSHQLGGFYNLPHGACNAVLLPAVEEYNSRHVPQLFIDIAKAMDVEDPGDNADKAVKLVLARIRLELIVMYAPKPATSAVGKNGAEAQLRDCHKSQRYLKSLLR